VSCRLLRLGDARLQRPAQLVPRALGPGIQRLIDRLVHTLHRQGLGSLSAPQIGVGLRVIALRAPAAAGQADTSWARRGALVLVNPVLESLDGEMQESCESCISLPGARGTVWRQRAVGFQAVDHVGCRVVGEAHGPQARVLQHQCDHLDGILFPSRMAEDWSREVSMCLEEQDQAMTTAQGWRVLSPRGRCH